MICVAGTELRAWLEGGGGHPLNPPPKGEWEGSTLHKGRTYLGKLAYHLKSQLPGQSRVSLNQWVRACLFRHYGGGYNSKDEMAVLDRMAYGANIPLRVFEVEGCGLNCSTRTKGSVHVKVLFVSTCSYHLPESPAYIYISYFRRLYFLTNNAQFFERYGVIGTAFHSWGEDEDSFHQRLDNQHPGLDLSHSLMISIRKRLFEKDQRFRLIFFLALGPVDENSLKRFEGLVKAGTWGGGVMTSAQGVIVTRGGAWPQYMLIPVGRMNLECYQKGAGARHQIQPENLKDWAGETPPSSSSSSDTSSPRTCPCEAGDTLFSSRPPKKLASPVGNSDASKDLVSNLKLLGLWTEAVEKKLVLTTWLSCLTFDIER